MSRRDFLVVGLDLPVDFCGVSPVVANGGLDQADRYLQVTCCLGRVAAVVLDDRDDLPHVLPRTEQPRAAARWPVSEPDHRMFVHPQAFLDVALRQGSRRKMSSFGARAKATEGGLGQAKAQGLAHVAHRSAL